jgi:hypothetical protein
VRFRRRNSEHGKTKGARTQHALPRGTAKRLYSKHAEPRPCGARLRSVAVRACENSRFSRQPVAEATQIDFELLVQSVMSYYFLSARRVARRVTADKYKAGVFQSVGQTTLTLTLCRTRQRRLAARLPNGRVELCRRARNSRDSGKVFDTVASFQKCRIRKWASSPFHPSKERAGSLFYAGSVRLRRNSI